jgi:oxygen-independent coproporphyrinogen-3 oxidase
MDGVEQALELLRRYDRPGPRYTSYPTAVQFHDGYTEEDYGELLAAADQLSEEPLSLYIHIPFCEERCTYCGCHVVITRKREAADKYLDYLGREIDLLAEALPRRRALSQYHWGGGTPNYLTVEQMAGLHSKVTEHFEIVDGAELAVEIDPRVTTREQIDLMRDSGFNRISMGVQDFTPEVQAAVNRRQSEEQTADLYHYCRSAGISSINLDLIYGLPLQTPESFSRTMEGVLRLRPDRLAVYSFAYVPWLKPHQKSIPEQSMPSPEMKLRLFCIARERMLAAGYRQIGMDHFALPEDELALAQERRRLHRNFMGYTVKKGGDMLGAGISAIGDLQDSFAQNVKKLSAYYEALDAGRFPIERGYHLDRDDVIRRDVIAKLMCNFHLNRGEIEKIYGIEFGSYFRQELEELAASDGPVAHGFLEIDSDSLEVVGNGRLFVRNICMTFDRYLRERESDGPTFSRTI